MQGSLEGIFWISFVLLAYTYVGYQLLMRLLARTGRSAAPAPQASGGPAVTIVLAAHNEEHRIGARLRNLLSADYPPDRLSVILVDDASTDQTVSQAKAIQDDRVHVLRNDRQRGKAACLNQALRHVRTEIVLFADARQAFEHDAIGRLVAHFSDARVGAVSGALELRQTAAGVGDSVGMYWKLERQLRRDEATWDSCIGCTGAIYAIRTKAFEPIPEDTILDDVVIPMRIVLQGYRVAYDMEAVASEPQEVAARTEGRRKRRTLAGNFQMLFRYPTWMLPWRNRAWWQLISHKYLRVLAPTFLLAMLLSNAALVSSPFYQLTLAAQLLFYAAAVTGLTAPRIGSRLVTIPAGFLFLNLSAVQGLLSYLRGTYSKGWKGG